MSQAQGAASAAHSPGSNSSPTQRLSTVHVIFMTGVHVGALASLWHATWANVALMVGLYVLTGLGITVGYHRLLAHRSFRTHRWMERLIATVGCIAMQGGPMRWVADHREHHFSSDSRGDPHDINRGMFFAHLGWLFYVYPEDYDKQRIRGRARDVARDPFMVWLERFHYGPGIAVGLALLATGGIPLFLWGFCTRLVVLYHSTWLVNSAAHKWGYRLWPKATGTNNWLVALVAFGEGWHNNHHAWPSSARQGLRAWELDVSWLVIRGMRRLRLAWDVLHVEIHRDTALGAVMLRG